MKYGKLLIFYLTIIIIGASIYFVFSNKGGFLISPPSASNLSTKQKTLSTQTASIGNVTYKVTPKNLSRSSSSWDFEISLDTHTGSLDQDLVSLILLSDGKNEYKALKWEGDPLGGHHREGILKFQPLGSGVTSVILKIKPGGNTEETSFTWEVKE